MQDLNKKTEVEYNHGAEDYVKQRNEIPYYQCVEIPSTLKIVGTLNGKSCLDIACGTGVYPRLYKKYNASKVVGIDISDAMIDIAKSYELGNKQDIQYTAVDVLNMGHIDNFDIITGIYLLHYFANVEMLENLAEQINLNLKSGGRFITCTTNPEVNIDPDYYRKYGFYAKAGEKLNNGDKYEIILEKVKQSFSAYYWSKEIYETVFRQNGFKNIKWVNPIITSDCLKKYGIEFWKNQEAVPWSIYLVMEKI